MEHIAYHALIAELDDERLEGGTTKGDDENAPPLIEIEMKHANDTLCGIIESLFNMFVTGTIEQPDDVVASEVNSVTATVSAGD